MGRVFLVSEPNNENTNNQWPPMNCRCKQFQENIEAVYLQWLNIISYHQCGCEQELDGKFIAKVKFSWKKNKYKRVRQMWTWLKDFGIITTLFFISNLNVWWTNIKKQPIWSQRTIFVTYAQCGPFISPFLQKGDTKLLV